MAEPGTAQHAPGQHVVVVGADTTTVRLAEELVRSGEQLVVIAHGENPARAGSSPGVAPLPGRAGNGDISITSWRATSGSRLLRPGPGWPGCYA